MSTYNENVIVKNGFQANGLTGLEASSFNSTRPETNDLRSSGLLPVRDSSSDSNPDSGKPTCGTRFFGDLPCTDGLDNYHVRSWMDDILANMAEVENGLPKIIKGIRFCGLFSMMQERDELIEELFNRYGKYKPQEVCSVPPSDESYALKLVIRHGFEKAISLALDLPFHEHVLPLIWNMVNISRSLVTNQLSPSCREDIGLIDDIVFGIRVNSYYGSLSDLDDVFICLGNHVYQDCEEDSESTSVIQTTLNDQGRTAGWITDISCPCSSPERDLEPHFVKDEEIKTTKARSPKSGSFVKRPRNKAAGRRGKERMLEMKRKERRASTKVNHRLGLVECFSRHDTHPSDESLGFEEEDYDRDYMYDPVDYYKDFLMEESDR
jgi:hypothetical protein